MPLNVKSCASIALAAILLPIAGCSERGDGARYSTGNAHEDKLVNHAIDEMMQPPPEKPVKAGWPAEGEPEASLAKLAEQVRDQFARYQEVEPLTYPEGWVRRVLEPTAVDHKLIRNDGSLTGIVELTYQKKSGVIHATREEAAADTELIPYPSAQTQEQMTAGMRRKPWPPVTLTIEYQLREDAGERTWQRIKWSAEPEVAEGADFLDRVGVP